MAEALKVLYDAYNVSFLYRVDINSKHLASVRFKAPITSDFEHPDGVLDDNGMWSTPCDNQSLALNDLIVSLQHHPRWEVFVASLNNYPETAAPATHSQGAGEQSQDTGTESATVVAGRAAGPS